MRLDLYRAGGCVLGKFSRNSFCANCSAVCADHLALLALLHASKGFLGVLTQQKSGRPAWRVRVGCRRCPSLPKHHAIDGLGPCGGRDMVRCED